MPQETFDDVIRELQALVHAQQRVIDTLRRSTAELIGHAKRADARTEPLLQFADECVKVLDKSTGNMQADLEAAINRLAARLKRTPISDGDVEQFLKRCIEQFGGGRPVWEQRDGND